MQKISDAMMMSKRITILEQMRFFNDNIQEWRRQTTDQKMSAQYNLFFYREYLEYIIAVTTAVRLVYTAAVQNIYGVLPPPSEEYHEVIEDIKNIVQGMQTQSCNLEVLAQTNVLITSSNTAVMA